MKVHSTVYLVMLIHITNILVLLCIYLIRFKNV